MVVNPNSFRLGYFADVRQQIDPSFSDTLKATLGYNYAPLGNMISNLQYTPQRDYDWKQDIGEYKQYAPNLYHAVSPEHMAALKQQIEESIYSGNKDFNHSMFSEYETFGLCNHLKYRDFQQTTIFFLRYKISGRLSNFQKKICKIFNCKHVTYEEHGSNKLRKSILYKDQKIIPFMMIILRQYIKFFGRKLRYLFT